MKAIVCTTYGSPAVLQLKDLAKPTPKDKEILIRIHAAVVGPSDCAFRMGDPFIVKLIYGLTRPRFSTQGVEFAGEIEAIGDDMSLFTIGDQVLGMSPDRFGAHAEYICLPEDKPVIIKPANTTYEEAAGICDGATTALTFLRDAVGAYAVQLAKYYEAEVTGVCSGVNVELVKSLGADRAIDYTKTDFTSAGQTYDVIFDAVGKSSFSRCKGALSEHGVYLSTVPTLGIVFQMVWTSVIGSKKAKFATAGLMQNKENLAFLKAYRGRQAKSDHR